MGLITHKECPRCRVTRTRPADDVLCATCDERCTATCAACYGVGRVPPTPPDDPTTVGSFVRGFLLGALVCLLILVYSDILLNWLPDLTAWGAK